MDRSHFEYKNKIAKAFEIILRTRKIFNKKTLLNLYHAFIFPYLIYCVEIWGNAANIYLDLLIKLQKKSSELLHSHNIWHTIMIYCSTPNSSI